MFKFSEYGVKNKELFQMIYGDFIQWCRTIVSTGTFSTYCDGEPVCFSYGNELSYRDYLRSLNKKT